VPPARFAPHPIHLTPNLFVAIGIGPVHKKDVMVASTMTEKNIEYACILAFDVKVTPDAREMADKMKVRIFAADIIYHLQNRFQEYIDELREAGRTKAKSEAIFPCALQILPEHVFNTRSPIGTPKLTFSFVAVAQRFVVDSVWSSCGRRHSSLPNPYLCRQRRSAYLFPPPALLLTNPVWNTLGRNFRAW